MRLIITIILFLHLADLYGQKSISKIDSAEVETYFRIYYGQEFFSQVKKIDLGKEPVSRILYYSYRITETDSIIWKKYNREINIIDSLSFIAFKKVFIDFKAENKTRFLRNQELTFIPVFILYKTKISEKGNEKIGIGPIEDIFGWAADADFAKNQPVNRVLAPLFFRFPLPKKYY